MALETTEIVDLVPKMAAQTLDNRHPYLAHKHHEHMHVPAGLAYAEFHAMGTTISFLLPEEQLQQGTEIIHTLFDVWEQTLSRFLAESELSQLNRLSGKPVMVSRLLFSVLNSALDAAHSTDGLYDPTLLNQLVQSGYDRSFDLLPANLPDAEAGHPITPGGQWHEIRLTAGPRLVTLPAGVQLDFGGIAKGMAVDAAMEGLLRAGIKTALLNAGGDLVVQGVPQREQQWPIKIQGKTCSWVIPFHHGALATSGIARRHWQQGTQLRHHLLDPRTGLSAHTHLWSVTVAAAQCRQADVAAKVVFLLGVEKGSAFLDLHGLAGLLLLEDGSYVTVGSWPKEAMSAEDQKEVEK
jgi:thiamine biosynthesis lipoprotein